MVQTTAFSGKTMDFQWLIIRRSFPESPQTEEPSSKQKTKNTNMASRTKEVMPAEMSVEQKLKNLYQLQTKLSEIDKIRTLRGELPVEVQDLEDEIEGLHHRLSKYEQEISDFEAVIVDKQNCIREARAMMENYRVQLDQVSNNREYDTLQKEIEYQSLEIELLNKQIRDIDRQIEARQSDLVKGRSVIKKRTDDLEVKKAELDEIVTETRAEEERLREKARSIEVSIEPRLLAAFKRIRKRLRNGLAIVYVNREACGGCFNKIPPQRQLDVRMHKKIIPCEFCGRILIDPELAGVKTEPVEETKRTRRGGRKTATAK